jgi:circadian clock protein KaiC
VLSPGELSAGIRDDVERNGAKLVVIDSLSGYLASMPAEEHLHLHLHELLTYLNQQGVVTIITMAQHGLVGSMRSADISYIADAVILLRFFEAFGAIKKAISVIKKRTGGHQETIREFSLAGGQVRVGQPLGEFQGVLSGTPTYHGRADGILPQPL